MPKKSDDEKETAALVVLSEDVLKDFLEDEPDLYSIQDIRVKKRKKK